MPFDYEGYWRWIAMHKCISCTRGDFIKSTQIKWRKKILVIKISCQIFRKLRASPWRPEIFPQELKKKGVCKAYIPGRMKKFISIKEEGMRIQFA